MKSKYAKVVLATCLASSVSAVASAASFKDTNIPWAKASIDKMVELGAVQGYPDGTFQPVKQITRAEMTTIMNKVFNKYDDSATTNFLDVKTSDWFYKQVASGKTAGYVSGYPDNTFHPSKSITRAEAAVMVAKALGLAPNAEAVKTFKDAAKIPGWAAGSVGALVSKGILNGYEDGTFGPTRNITRAEAVVMLDKAGSSSDQKPVATKGINGSVTLDGKAVADVSVKLFKNDAYEVDKTVTSGTNGSFKFDVVSGTYDLVAVQGKNVGYAADVQVAEAGATPEIKMTQGVEVKGKLLDRNGNALRYAKLALSANGVSFTAETDANGKFTAVVPPSQSYTLRAVDPNKTSAGFQVITTVEIGKEDTTLADIKTTFAYVSSGGGGGSSSSPTKPDVDVISEAVAVLDPLNDTLITVTTNGKVVTEINDLKAEKVDGKQNTYRVTVSKDATKPAGTLRPIEKIEVEGMAAPVFAATTVVDPLGDNLVIITANNWKTLKVNNATAEEVAGKPGERRVTISKNEVVNSID